MSFSDPNQHFCEVNLSFGLSRRNFKSLMKPGGARWNLTAPVEVVQKDALPNDTRSAQRSPREADTSHGLLLCHQLLCYQLMRV